MNHLTVEMDTAKGPWVENAIFPLASYNSLTDSHLVGYFSSPRRRKHLRKVGLINRSGHLISENTYRLNMARKDQKRQIKNTLAQAIVEKTLELERQRQNVIKQKLEEIAKIELVQRVREHELQQPITKWSSRPNSSRRKKTSSTRRAQSASERRRKEAEELLPYLSPRSPRRPVSGPANARVTGGTKGKGRPISAPANARPESGSTRASTNYEDDDDEDVEYLDEDGHPIEQPANDYHGNQNGFREEQTLDLNQLYTLNTAALRKYAMTLAKLEQGRTGSSPYVTTQVPIPPKSPRALTSASRSRRYNSNDKSPTRRTANGQTYLHHTESLTTHPGQLQSMVQITMKYHGWALSLARDEVDPRNLVVVEQQHCGGNTLSVFKEKLLPKSEFTFYSHRHRGYPFSLTIYVDGRMDSRISTCCEYRHALGVRLGGANGHFSILNISGKMPCYKCQVQKGRKKKRKKRVEPEQTTEEVVVMETHQASENVSTEMEDQLKEDKQDHSDSDSEDSSGNYDDDFEASDEEQDKTTPKKDESHIKVQGLEDDNFDDRPIKGIAVESPRGSEGTTTTEVEKDGRGDTVIGRKIDAYSSEEEDLEGDRSKIVPVEENQDQNKVRIKGNNQQRDKRHGENGQRLHTTKSAPVKPPKGGGSPREGRSPGNRRKVIGLRSSGSESESDIHHDRSPGSKKRLILSPGTDSSEISVKRPQVKEDSKKQKRRNASEEVPSNKGDSENFKLNTPARKGKIFNKHKPRGDKDQRVAEEIVKEFGENETEKENKKINAIDKKKKVRVAEQIVKEFGNDDDNTKNKRVAEEIVKEFGNDQIEQKRRGSFETVRKPENNEETRNHESKNTKVAEDFVKVFGKENIDNKNMVAQEIVRHSGKDNEKNIVNDHDTSKKRIAEEIVKEFGQNDQEEDQNKRVAEEIVKEFGNDVENKNKQVAEAIVNEYGQNGNTRVAEEIVKEFGHNDDGENQGQRVAEEIVKEFGTNDDQTKNERIADAVVKEFGHSDQNKNKRVAEEIVKEFGTDVENKNKQVAEAIVNKYGQNGTNEENIKTDNASDLENKDKRVAEEIVQKFGHDQDVEEKNKRIANEIVKEFGENESAENKNGRVAEEIVKEFGQEDSQMDTLVSARDERGREAAEQLLMQFGGNVEVDLGMSSSQEKKDNSEPAKAKFSFGRVDPLSEEVSELKSQQEVDKLYESQRPADEQEKPVPSDSRDWRSQEEVKKLNNLDQGIPERKQEEGPIEKTSAQEVSKSLPPDPNLLQISDTRERSVSEGSTTSTDRVIQAKKRDSAQFFQPALEKKRESTSTDSDSSSGSETESDSDSGDSTSSDSATPTPRSDSKPANTEPSTGTDKQHTEVEIHSRSNAQKSDDSMMQKNANNSVSNTTKDESKDSVVPTTSKDGTPSADVTGVKQKSKNDSSGSEDSSTDSDSETESSASTTSSATSSDNEEEKKTAPGTGNTGTTSTTVPKNTDANPQTGSEVKAV